jgi:hypothetical protein
LILIRLNLLEVLLLQGPQVSQNRLRLGNVENIALIVNQIGMPLKIIDNTAESSFKAAERG